MDRFCLRGAARHGTGSHEIKGVLEHEEGGPGLGHIHDVFLLLLKLGGEMGFAMSDDRWIGRSSGPWIGKGLNLGGN